KASTGRRIGCAGGCPTIGARIVLPAGVQGIGTDKSTPDDHLGTRPDRCMLIPACRNVGGTGGCPTIHGWIVSPARVQIHTDISSPDANLPAGPPYPTIPPAARRLGEA